MEIIAQRVAVGENRQVRRITLLNVLVPWDRDQPGGAARAERRGVAAIVRRSELSDEAIGQAINRVLQDSRYRDRAAAGAHRLQAQDPSVLASQLIEQL